MFRQGQEAAARLIRALAVPDRGVQLAIAKVLIDAGERVSTVIAQDGIAAYELERWTGDEPEATHALNLRKWLTGPDAIRTGGDGSTELPALPA